MKGFCRDRKLGLKPESLSRTFHKLKDYGVSIDRNKAGIDAIRALIDLMDTDRAEILRPRDGQS